MIFAPSASDESYARQRNLLERHGAGFADHYLLALHLLKEGLGVIMIEPVAPEQAAAVLVGRDGGVKVRSDEPVPTPDLFAHVDAMPMRRREMREKARR